MWNLSGPIGTMGPMAPYNARNAKPVARLVAVAEGGPGRRDYRRRGVAVCQAAAAAGSVGAGMDAAAGVASRVAGMLRRRVCVLGGLLAAIAGASRAAAAICGDVPGVLHQPDWEIRAGQGVVDLIAGDAVARGIARRRGADRAVRDADDDGRRGAAGARRVIGAGNRQLGNGLASGRAAAGGGCANTAASV